MHNLEKMMQQILAKMNSYQEKAEASMAKLLEDKMDSYQKKAEASMAKLLEDKMDAKVDSYQEKAEASMAKLLEDKMDAKMDSYQKKAEAGMAKLLEDKMDTKMDSYQEKSEASMAKLEEKIEEIMEAFLTRIDTIREKTTTCNEATEKTEPDPDMMQSAEEHQDIPNEVTAVMPVRGLRKRCRVWKLAAEHLQKSKEGTRGYCESRRRVTVASKRTSHHATVAWQKRKLLSKSETQDNCGPLKNFAAAGMRKGSGCKNDIKR
jgi:Skp family chaperone for outer membrane proteins